jgi:hypothetical protein
MRRKTHGPSETKSSICWANTNSESMQRFSKKAKRDPAVRADESTFYQYAWYYHAKFIIPLAINKGHDLLVTAAALEMKKGKAAFKLAFNNVVQQTAPNTKWAADFPMSASDPCLQAADYCAWAIQRKWEMNDPAVRDKYLGAKIATEFDLWRSGTHHWY